ncbi:MAG: HAMP domain-containing histidine kinase [Nitrospirae bacterium]|nr:HAMP domain-containing histidine kinase [Nitrospirota bacterium]
MVKRPRFQQTATSTEAPLELHTDRHARMPEAISPDPTEAAASDPAAQQRARSDLHFTHHDYRGRASLTRCQEERADQVRSETVFGSSESVDQGFPLLITGATRLSSVAENVRGLPDAKPGQGGLSREHFDAVELLRDLMVSTRALVAGKSVKVEMVATERPLTLWSDSGKFLQIAANLLENAAQYTDRGRITLILGRQQDHLTLMVTDTGKGMSGSEVKRLSALMTGNAGRKAFCSAALGTGLPRTRSLVEFLGGTLSFVSKWNEGTIVEVRLPLVPGSAEQTPCRELPARSRT